MDLSISHQHTEGLHHAEEDSHAENPLRQRPWTLCNLLCPDLTPGGSRRAGPNPPATQVPR